MTNQTNTPKHIIDRVREFIDTFEPPMSPEFWVKLMQEESQELREACAALMKELADVLYVSAGYTVAIERAGRQMTEEEKEFYNSVIRDMVVFDQAYRGETPPTLVDAFDIVHRSNMSKVANDGKPVRDPETGKIMKDGTNYWPAEPELLRALFGDTSNILLTNTKEG